MFSGACGLDQIPLPQSDMADRVSVCPSAGSESGGLARTFPARARAGRKEGRRPRDREEGREGGWGRLQLEQVHSGTSQEKRSSGLDWLKRALGWSPWLGFSCQCVYVYVSVYGGREGTRQSEDEFFLSFGTLWQ